MISKPFSREDVKRACVDLFAMELLERRYLADWRRWRVGAVGAG